MPPEETERTEEIEGTEKPKLGLEDEKVISPIASLFNTLLEKKEAKRPVNPYDEKLYPSALGRELPKKVPGMFSAVAECEIVGAGPNARRIIRTVPKAGVDIKIPALGLQSELPVENGLAQIFDAVKRGKAETK